MALPQFKQATQFLDNRKVFFFQDDNFEKEKNTANTLAAYRAMSMASNRQQNPPPNDDAITDEDEDEDDEDYDDTDNGYENEDDDDFSSPEEEEEPEQTTGASTYPRQQIGPDMQQQTAIAMANKRQADLRMLKNQEQALDAETEGLIKELKGFKESKGKRSMNFFKPRISITIDTLLTSLQHQSSRSSYKKRIAVLTGALITIGSLLAMLRGFRFIAAIIDSVSSWIRWIIKTIETIVGAIIIFLLGFIIVPFGAVLFYIDKIPTMKGKITHEVVEMIEKLKKRQAEWQQKLQQLKKIVARQNQKKAIQKMEKQTQKPGQGQMQR